ncbi:MAG: protein kinase [Planctomycetes bacterium]|nr:protein kinase [Planctomycetota bacterium]
MPSPSDSNIRKSIPGASPSPSFQHQLDAARRNPNLNLGKFTLLEELGHGGMGVVYRAWQNDLQRMVAIKLLPANSPKESAQRFLREARLASKLRHPNIVAVHEMGEHQGRPWFSMDLIDGGSLDPLVRGRKLPVKRLMEILGDMARALDFAHKAGVVHRDIKPANILLGSDGKPYLTDFGLAGDLEGTQGRLTLSGALMGTPAYMSPEQARGRKGMPDARTDIFSLGAVMYEGLTGHTAVPRGDIMEMVTSILHAEPEAPTSRVASVPRDTETICLKCLQKDASRRYQTAGELADDIEHFLRGEPISARPSTLLEKAGRRAANPLVLAGAAVAIVLVLAIGWFVRHESAKEREIAELREMLAKATTPEERARVAAAIAEKTGTRVEVPRPNDAAQKPADPIVKPTDPPVKPADPEIRKPPHLSRTETASRDVRGLLDRGEFANALRVVDDFKPESADEKAWKENSLTLIDAEAKAAFLRIDGPAQALADAGNLAGAIVAWGEAKKIGLPSTTQLAEDRIAAARALQSAGNRDAAIPKLGPLRDEILAACSTRRYADAVRAIDKLEKSEPSLAGDLAPIRSAVEGAAAVLPAAPKGAGAMKGQKVAMGNVDWEITGGTESKLELRSGPSTSARAWADLPVDLIASLAAAGGASPEQVGAFLLFEGKADLAAKAWAASPRRAELDALATTFRDAGLQRESREALAQLFKAAEEKNAKKVKELLALRGKFGETAAWRESAAKIDDIAYDAEGGVGDEPFAVKPRKAGAGYEWRYDFSKPDQMRDWAEVSDGVYTAVRSHGLSLDAGAVQVTNAVLEFSAPLEGEMRLTADVALKSVGKSSSFGVFLGGYVVTLATDEGARLYTPGENQADEAANPGIEAGKTYRFDMSVGRAGIRFALGDRQILKAALTEPPLPLPARFWALREVVLAVDNVTLSGQLAPEWSAEAKTRLELAARATRPSSLGKIEMLLEGGNTGKFTVAEPGPWDPVDGGLKGASASLDSHAELHMSGEEHYRRNFRLKLQYLVHSGCVVEMGCRMESAGLVHFHLPTDVQGKWREVEILVAEELATCVIDGVVRVAPDSRPAIVAPGGLRIVLQGATVSFRNITIQDVNGIPETPKWTPVWEDKVKPKELKLDGLDWDKDSHLVKGQGALEWAVKGATEVKWIVGNQRGGAIRLEVRGEPIFEYHVPERMHDLTLRIRGDVADVLWNGTPVVRGRKLGKGTGPIRLVASGGDVVLGWMLERALPR